MNILKCKMCELLTAEVISMATSFKVDCKRCGKYIISDDFHDDFRNDFSSKEKAKISGWIRQNPNSEISESLLSLIVKINISVNEKAIRLLSWLDHKTQSPGETIEINLQDESSEFLELLSICWSYDRRELIWLINYLRDRNLIEKINNIVQLIPIVITPLGFIYLEETKLSSNSNLGFCAMWFDKSLFPAWEFAIEPAIRSASYDALRIDKHEHNDGVVDEILALVRQSKFVVADLTGNRGGVYYEAGFAKGLGHQVIFTCNEDFFQQEKTHFDVNHYNIILWKTNEYDLFKLKLQNRIESTIGRALK